jgi:cytochrome oxidase Cu insertion factor (SCO1/SenC/PrrC family)
VLRRRVPLTPALSPHAGRGRYPRIPGSSPGRRVRGIAVVFALAMLAFPAWPSAHKADAGQPLPVIGPAPNFALTSQDGKPVSLTDLRGKVVAVTFIYTECPDICPMLTQKMVQVQDELGPDFGKKIAFVSISLDPEDTLRFYALRLHEAGMIKSGPQKIIADGTEWRFLDELKRELKA